MTKISDEAAKMCKLLNLPQTYFIDKQLLKKNYFLAAKKLHPDLNIDHKESGFLNCITSKIGGFFKIKNEEKNNIESLNKAFLIFNDDFNRAKCFFTNPDKNESTNVDNEFLSNCLDLEDRINKGENVKDYLNYEIETCKQNIQDAASIVKWGYYNNLLQKSNFISKK